MDRSLRQTVPAGPVAGDPTDEAHWVFGYGSLIWRPAFPHVERRSAHLHDFARRFWQRSIDHRGTPDAPGRVVTLVQAPGEVCAGVAFRVAAEAIPEVLALLDERERGGYTRRRLEVCLTDPAGAGASAASVAETTCWVYVADPSNPCYAGPTPLSEIAAIAGRAHGPSGPNREYVLRLAAAIAELGAADAELFSLAALVEREAS